MKIFKSPQRVLILFLSVFLILSSIFIVRLEIKAASLQSRLDEHHKSLEKNKDILYDLDTFKRIIKNNGIIIGDKVALINAGHSSLSLQESDIEIESNGNITFSIPTKSFFYMGKDGKIKIGHLKDKNFGYDPNVDLLYMKHKNAHVSLGDIYQDGKSHGILIQNSDGKNTIMVTDEEIVIGSKTKGDDYRIDISPDKQIMSLKKGNSFLKFEKDDIQFGASPDIYFQYDTKKDLISMLHQNAHVSLGDILQDGKSHGILIQDSDGKNSIMVSDEKILMGSKAKDGDYRIDIIPGNQTISLTKGKSFFKLIKDNIEVEANGDINITSKNGDVNINGKKVNLNE